MNNGRDGGIKDESARAVGQNPAAGRRRAGDGSARGAPEILSGPLPIGCSVSVVVVLAPLSPPQIARGNRGSAEENPPPPLTARDGTPYLHPRRERGTSSASSKPLNFLSVATSPPMAPLSANPCPALAGPSRPQMPPLPPPPPPPLPRLGAKLELCVHRDGDRVLTTSHCPSAGVGDGPIGEKLSVWFVFKSGFEGVRGPGGLRLGERLVSG